MQNNQSPEEFLTEVKDQIHQYVNLELELIKIETVEKSAKVTGYLISSVIFVFLIFMCILFLSLLLGFYLSEISNSNIKGFGIVALIYLVTILIYSLIKQNLVIKPISNKIIKMIYENE
jgi:hypothetical protein